MIGIFHSWSKIPESPISIELVDEDLCWTMLTADDPTELLEWYNDDDYNGPNEDSEILVFKINGNVEYTPKTLEEVYDILEEMVMERDM